MRDENRQLIPCITKNTIFLSLIPPKLLRLLLWNILIVVTTEHVDNFNFVKAAASRVMMQIVYTIYRVSWRIVDSITLLDHSCNRAHIFCVIQPMGQILFPLHSYVSVVHMLLIPMRCKCWLLLVSAIMIGVWASICPSGQFQAFQFRLASGLWL